VDEKELQTKLIDELRAALTLEHSLARTLRAQALVTPRGGLRRLTKRHLRETDDHAQRVEQRLDELGAARGALGALIGLVEGTAGSLVGLASAPVSLVRGGRETPLRNAMGNCAAEAEEIARYTVVGALAKELGDDETAQLASSILRDEKRTLDALTDLLPSLAVGADGDLSAEGLATTGAAEALRDAGGAAVDAARGGARAAARASRSAPALAVAEDRVKGVLADGDELPISGYDSLSAQEVASRLSQLSQSELTEISAYEAAHEKRRTVLTRIESLRESEPWSGYDEMTVAEIRSILDDGEDADRVAAYERRHKARAGVLDATGRARATA